MPRIKKDFSTQELEACLLTLDGEETTAQQVLLRDLCPCRSRCYDRTVWLAICRARDSSQPEVRHQAEHALETLLERARTDEQSQELRDWLLAKSAFEMSLGRLETPGKQPREVRKRKEKVTSQDMPRLLDLYVAGKLKLDESDRLLRFMRLQILAAEVFESPERAQQGQSTSGLVLCTGWRCMRRRLCRNVCVCVRV